MNMEIKYEVSYVEENYEPDQTGGAQEEKSEDR